MVRNLILPLLVACAITPLAAQTTPFTKIADTETLIPDGTGTFVTFSNMVSVDLTGDVAFSEDNFEDPGNDGIHFWSGGVLTRVADLNTVIPGGTGTFESFSFYGNGIEGGTIAFRGDGTGVQTGLYAFDGGVGGSGTLSLIANTNTPIPNGTGNFTGFTTAYVDGTDFAFIADGGSDQQGIYLTDGATLTRVADRSSVVPGIGGTYSWSSQLGFDSGNISFRANVTGGSAPGDIIAAYTPTGGLATLVTTNTAVPGLATSYMAFPSPADLSGTTVVFSGIYPGGSGIFTIDVAGGPISTLARSGGAAPGGGGSFIGFDPPCIDGDVVAFRASSGNFISGIYLHDGVRLRKVISTTDSLDGKSILALNIFENSVAGGYLAFRVSFGDGTRGIYRLEISELVDTPDLSLIKEKAALRKEIKRITRQLKKFRKAGQSAKTKRFAAQLRGVRKELRQL